MKEAFLKERVECKTTVNINQERLIIRHEKELLCSQK